MKLGDMNIYDRSVDGKYHEISLYDIYKEIPKEYKNYKKMKNSRRA